MKRIFDLKNLECPKPVIETKKILEKYKGEQIEIILNSQTALENVKRLLTNSNISFLQRQEECDFILNFINTGIDNKDIRLDISCETNFKKNIIITSQCLGREDEKLGKILMKSFFYSLAESSLKPKNLFFINSGVFLTTQGSQVIEELKKISSAGTLIYSCGTCLDYYNLKDNLIIGSVGNMTILLELLSEEPIIL